MLFRPSTFCWHHDNGINQSMISDKQRNQFYYSILKSAVKDKVCIDVGFGTGLLSLIALEHGAKKILAFETNTERYLLGIELIKNLQLENFIDLKNERYHSGYFKETSYILIQEIVGHNLWNEGLRFILGDSNFIIPGNFFCEYYYCPLEKKSFDELKIKETECVNEKIDLGINLLNLNFLNFLNTKKNLISSEKIINLCDQKISKDSYRKLISSGLKVGEYSVFANDKIIKVNDSIVEYKLNSKQTGIIDTPIFVDSFDQDYAIILCKFKIGHQDFILDLYDIESHWSLPNPICILQNKNYPLSLGIRTYLDDGLIRVYET